jgi:hypothetical protein
MASPRVLDGGHAVHHQAPGRNVDGKRAVIVSWILRVYQTSRAVDRYSTERVDNLFHRLNVDKCKTVEQGMVRGRGRRNRRAGRSARCIEHAIVQ